MITWALVLSLMVGGKLLVRVIATSMPTEAACQHLSMLVAHADPEAIVVAATCVREFAL